MNKLTKDIAKRILLELKELDNHDSHLVLVKEKCFSYIEDGSDVSELDTIQLIEAYTLESLLLYDCVILYICKDNALIQFEELDGREDKSLMFKISDYFYLAID